MVESDDPARPGIAGEIRLAAMAHHITIVTGAPGLGQAASVRLALGELPGRELAFADGRWLTGGYLAGLHELLAQLLAWAELHVPDLVARHEQTLKRIWPTRGSAAYRVPKDLTNCADREERTRFYHYEYQGKLLVGLADFILDALQAGNRSVILVIDDAGELAPTCRNLIAAIGRQKRGITRLSFVLLDHEGTLFLPGAARIVVPPYAEDDFNRALDLSAGPRGRRELIHMLSRGNLRVGRALRDCFNRGITTECAVSAESVVDFHIATLSPRERAEQALAYVRDGFRGGFIAQRSVATIDAALLDGENLHRHEMALERYRRGAGPLVLAHALAISDKFRRIAALVEPCAILMAIGLYDTWFSFFMPLFADPQLRAHGDGEGEVAGLFINAAFVLYAMGNAAISAPFIEEFLTRFPRSHFIPTALYAQSMTYGRYQIPVDLDRAEAYATRNLALIDASFRDHHKYAYIHAFAENAYAYIKARQGRFAEAMALCERGNADIVAAYGEKAYQLHRSILIYNTSQIHEIVGDYAAAEVQLRSAIACDPYYAEYYNDLGNLLAKAGGRAAEALAAYDRAIALSPPYYEAHLNRGVLRAQGGDIAGALTDFERVLAIKPREWRALREIGNVWLQNGDVAAALDCYTSALDHEVRDADLHANLGLACSELGEGQRAIHHYRLAIALNPGQAAAHNNLAAELVGLGRFNEARDHARLAATHGRDPDYSANLAVIDSLCGRPRID